MTLPKPRLPKALAHRVVAGAAAVLVLGGGAGLAYAEIAAGPSYAAAAAPSTGAPSTAPASGAAHARAHRRLLTRAVHVEAIVKTKAGYETVDVDRGTVDAISTTSITITRPDGPQVKANVTPSTKFRGEQESQIQNGQKVEVVQEGGNAIAVGSRKPGGSPGAAQGSSTQSS